MAGRIIAAFAAAVLATACGQPRHTTGPGATAPRASQAIPMVAVLDAPFGSVPNTLRVVGLDGVEAGRVSLPEDAEAVAVGGDRVLVAGGGRLLGADDAEGTLTALTPIETLTADGPDALVRGLVVSPDGDHWLFSTVLQHPDGTVTSRLHLGGPGEPDRVLDERTAPGSALEPVAWTAGGAVVADEPLGIGGYVLFRRTFGPTSLLDTHTGELRPLTSAACAFSDLAADGTVACIVDGREGPNDGGPVTLRIVPRTGPIIQVPLPDGVRQAGAAYFDPGGRWLSLASSPATGDASEPVTDELVDRHDGSVHPLSATGLIPVGWLPGGRLLAERPTGIEGGDTGTWMVMPGSGATRLSTGPLALGLL